MLTAADGAREFDALPHLSKSSGKEQQPLLTVWTLVYSRRLNIMNEENSKFSVVDIEFLEVLLENITSIVN